MKILAPLALALLALGCDPAPRKSATSTGAGVLTLTTRDFPALKAQSKPVLMDFWAPWCGPCRQQGPIVEEVAAQAGTGAVVAKINVDDEKELARQFEVQAIPTLVILKDGAVVQRFVGVQSADVLLNAIKAAQ